MFLPAEKAKILDTWDTLGMRGTGSHDAVIESVFIPERHTALVAPLEKPGTAFEGPLYRLTIWTAVALLAVPALGVARAAIDEMIETGPPQDAELHALQTRPPASRTAAGGTSRSDVRRGSSLLV